MEKVVRAFRFKICHLRQVHMSPYRTLASIAFERPETSSPVLQVQPYNTECRQNSRYFTNHCEVLSALLGCNAHTTHRSYTVSPRNRGLLGKSSISTNFYPLRGISFLGFGSSERNAWQQAVSEAEKLVGYPTSFMSLRCLLSDELSNVAIQVRKLVGTNHPLLKTARTFVYDGRNTMQTRGLIVLLVSKAAGPTTSTVLDNREQQSIVSGIYSSQRALAEITEMIHTAYLVHKGVVNLKDLQPSDGPAKDMEFGNKMAVLSGDFLLANASTGLAQLHNTKVVELVSSAIRDIMEAEFTGYSVHQCNTLDNNMKLTDWVELVFLSAGSLIAKSCQAALHLANHNSDMQQLAFEYGKFMSLCQQLSTDLSPFTDSSHSPSAPLNLNSVPVILYLQHLGSKDITHQYCKDDKIDFKALYTDILSSGVLEQAKSMCDKYGEKALQAIQSFPVSDARGALQNIIRAITVKS